MKARKVPDKLKRVLAARSAGRCELCSKYLYKDIFGNDTNLAELAHNVPFSENGPRSEASRKDVTPSYRFLEENDGYNVDNLLVLCPSCHKAIDDNPALYTKEYLINLKKTKEKAIYEAVSKTIKEKTAVKFSSPIADKIVSISDDEIKKTLFNEYTIINEPIIDLSNELTRQKETYCEYLTDIANRTEKLFKQKIELSPELNSRGFVLFGFAPQPLLIKLGTLLNNYHNIEIRENSRTTKWSWKGGQGLDFELIQPKTINKSTEKISLLIEVSASLKNEEICDKSTDIWRISVLGEKIVDLVGSRSDLEKFEHSVYQFFNKIKENYGSKIQIDLYSAMPLSLSIKFGSIYMPNAFNKITIYDKIKDENGIPKFVKALDIF